MVHSLCSHKSVVGDYDEVDYIFKQVMNTTEYVFPGPDLGILNIGDEILQTFDEEDETELYQSIGTFSLGNGTDLTNS